MHNEKHQNEALNVINAETIEVSGRVDAETATCIELQTEIVALNNRLELLSEKIDMYIAATKVCTITLNDTTVHNELYCNKQLVTLPIGTVVPFTGAATSLPFGWLICNNNTIVSKERYPELYQLIGERVPDLTGRFIKGVDLSDTLKSRPDGNSKPVLTENNLPRIDPCVKETFSYVEANSDRGVWPWKGNKDYCSFHPLPEHESRESISIGSENPAPIDITPPHLKMMYIIKAL